MFGQTQYANTNALLNSKLTERRPLIAVHRGAGQGMIVENTAAAVLAAVRSRADMVEIDVVESSDGEYFVFHEGMEQAHFGFDHELSTLSSAEIDRLTYGHGWRIEGPHVHVERLETVLRSFPGVLFNIDRSWGYWSGLLPWLDQFDMAEQVILKAVVDSDALAILRAHPVKYPLIAILRSADELEQVIDDPDINMVAAELIAPSQDHTFCDPGWVAALRARGKFVYVNALDLGNGDTLMAGWDDTRSVLGDPDEGWGRLVNLGADVIQTDWPLLLSDYLAHHEKVQGAQIAERSMRARR
jgi:glycerophosphoryl diester phosphodiesterase